MQRIPVAWLPVLLACIVTLVNCLKPVVVDDTAYLAFARQIAVHPSDPYGFTFFWWTIPENAFEILCPPLVPYWLALGIGLIGENPALLKLWMFPFVWLLAWSIDQLLKRFAAGTEGFMLPLVMLSPAILPTVNLMLDVPALALALTSVVLLTRACSSRSIALAILAGVFAGLAMQTKYTALLIPPVLGLYGLIRRSWIQLGQAVVAIIVSMIVFAGWEWLLIARYGRSHFLFHLTERKPATEGGTEALVAFILDKATLIPPLAADFGCLAIGVGLVAALALGVRQARLRIAVIIATLGFLWIVFTPSSWNWLPTTHFMPPLNVATLYWILTGILLLLSVAACAFVQNVRLRRSQPLRCRGDALFLAGWMVIELGGYFVLTPFGAARRVMGLVVIGSLIVARLQHLVVRIRPDRHPTSFVIVTGILAGFTIAFIDLLDAFPEKYCAERAAEVIARQEQQPAVFWFAGHWGFQYYCGRLGMQQIVPGQTTIAPGDYMVLPVYPDSEGFHRPYIGSVRIQPPENVVKLIDIVSWDDPFSAKTIPNFYGGDEPLIGRDDPRLRVAVYRCIESWSVPGK